MFSFLESHVGLTQEFWEVVIPLTFIIGITVCAWVMQAEEEE
jgi:hypothetical protein